MEKSVFDYANQIYSDILAKGTVVVRGAVYRPSQLISHERARVDIIDLAYTREIKWLNHFRWTWDTSYQSKQSSVDFSPRQLYVTIKSSAEYHVDCLAGIMSDWHSHELFNDERFCPWFCTSSFVGCHAIQTIDKNRYLIDAHSPIIFHYLNQCLGQLDELWNLTRCRPDYYRSAARSIAMEKTLGRYRSFIIQAQKSNLDAILGRAIC